MGERKLGTEAANTTDVLEFCFCGSPSDFRDAARGLYLNEVFVFNVVERFGAKLSTVNPQE